jgi:hypothetical protein
MDRAESEHNCSLPSPHSFSLSAPRYDNLGPQAARRAGKHNRYRLIVRRDGKVVQLFARRGYDWTERYSGIAATAAKLRAKSFTLDGETVVPDAAGMAVFEALLRQRIAARIDELGTLRQYPYDSPLEAHE